MKSVTKYQAVCDYTVTAYDEEDRQGKGDDLQSVIDYAKKETEDDGRTRYITQVIHVVKPVKQPYEVNIEEYK